MLNVSFTNKMLEIVPSVKAVKRQTTIIITLIDEEYFRFQFSKPIKPHVIYNNDGSCCHRHRHRHHRDMCVHILATTEIQTEIHEMKPFTKIHQRKDFSFPNIHHSIHSGNNAQQDPSTSFS